MSKPERSHVRSGVVWCWAVQGACAFQVRRAHEEKLSSSDGADGGGDTPPNFSTFSCHNPLGGSLPLLVEQPCGSTVRQMDAMFHHARSSKQNYLRQSKSAIVGNGPRQGRVKARSMSSNIPGKAGLTMSALDNQSPPKNRGRLVQGETLFCTRCSEDERSPY